MTKSLVAIIGAAVCAGGAAAQPAASVSGAWAGNAQFTRGGGTDFFTLSIEVRGRRAIVALGPGHAATTEAAARISGRRSRLTLPGRPWRLKLDGRIRGRVLFGTIRQGPLRGSFRLRRSVPLEGATLGLYLPGGTHGLIRTENGLLAEAARSNRVVDGLWTTIRDWLDARGFSPAS